MIEEERLLGKREMLWNIQRQIKAMKIKGKKITEESINNIILSLGKMQYELERMHEIYDYENCTEIDKDIIRNSNDMLQDMSK